MQKRLLWVLALVSLLGSSAAHARKTELVDPQPIQVANLSLEKIAATIDTSILQQRWIKKGVVSEQPHVIEVEYFIRSHRVLMTIEYDTSNVKLAYVNSQNLNYETEKGTRYIHRNYMVWTQALADQISINLSQGGVSAPAATSASPANTSVKVPGMPSESFNNFSSFKLEKATLAKKYNAIEGNVNATRNLDARIEKSLKPKLASWADASKPARSLSIKPHVEAVRFIGSGARFFAGSMAGRSWIYVKLTCIDDASGAVISETEFYRVADRANGFTLARADYKMVEDVGDDIARFVESNYSKVVGGGAPAPQNIRAEAAE